MKVLTSIKGFMLRVWHSQFFKYSVVCIIGVLIVGFLDENSFYSHFKNMERIDELTTSTTPAPSGRKSWSRASTDTPSAATCETA